MPHIIFHIDVNSAYLSWTAVEQLKNGAGVDIRTIPAIIGGDQKSRHGIGLAVIKNHVTELSWLNLLRQRNSAFGQENRW